MAHRNCALSITIAVLVSLLPNAARSQPSTGPPCTDRTTIVRNLHHRFGERLVGYGLSMAGTLIEVYAAPSGTWTIISTNPAGMSCLVATGEAWEGAQPSHLGVGTD